MNARILALWQPSAAARIFTLLFASAVSGLVGYLHMQTGFAYEFHVLFILPVLIVSWLIGTRSGYAIAILTTAIWFVADRLLEGEQGAGFPLVFNTAMRLTIFIYCAWMLGQMRLVMDRESRLARQDALTRLPNRREFSERGRQAFAQAQRQGASFTAVFIDLDRFKEINDRLGHETGDRLLATVAGVIRTHVRESDIPGRLGGDEFALLLPNMGASQAETYVEKLRLELMSVMRSNDWPVTFSIGVASHQVAPSDFDALLAEADTLMYQAKNSRRGHDHSPSRN